MWGQSAESEPGPDLVGGVPTASDVAASVVTKDAVVNVARETYEQVRMEKETALREGRDIIVHRLSDGVEVSLDPTWVGIIMSGDQRVESPPLAEVRRLSPLLPEG